MFRKTRLSQVSFATLLKGTIIRLQWSRGSLLGLVGSQKENTAEQQRLAKDDIHQATRKGVSSQEKSNRNCSNTSGNHGKTTHNVYGETPRKADLSRAKQTNKRTMNTHTHTNKRTMNTHTHTQTKEQWTHTHTHTHTHTPHPRSKSLQN